MSLTNEIDIIRAYELSWLNSKGKPEIGLLEVFATDQNLLDTWELKKTFENLNHEQFDNSASLERYLKNHLQHDFKIITPKDFSAFIFFEQLDLSGMLLVSNGFRYICKDSDQPQIGTLNVVYPEHDHGGAECREKLLTTIQNSLQNTRNSKYTVLSFTQEIFSELQTTTDFLMSAHFHRRGGISVQMIRTTQPMDLSKFMIRSILE